LFVERAAATMNEFELTDADAAIVAEICENWTEFRLRSSLQQPASRSRPPDRTVPMPGKMARSATRPPFGLPEGAGSRPHLASVFQGRRKSNNIHASSGVIWGIPAKILPQIPLGRLGEPEEIAGLIIYLCSDGAAFVTGADIAINGGQHMQ
jgi:Enoyl-(Acyl carrier protein) reductase